jgi:hypothetical protein
MASGKGRRNSVEAAAEKDHGEWRARRIVAAGLAVFGITIEELRKTAKSDWRKGLMAEMIQRQTTMKLDWIGKELRMGERSSCCRIIRKVREKFPKQKEWEEKWRDIERISINHA